MIKNVLKNIVFNKIIIIFAILLLFFIYFCNFSNNYVYAGTDNLFTINNYIARFYTSVESDVKNRTAGSVGELAMAENLSEYLLEKNYQTFNESETYFQQFEISENKTSNNVVGFKDNSAEKYVVLGAHYDSFYVANNSYGYNDNLSGIVASILTAELLQDETNFNIILVFFGAEEVGCVGSKFFVKSLPEQIRENVMLFVNFDSVGAGDYLYYYHSDFPTTYGTSIDSTLQTNTQIEKYANQLYSTNANNNVNYTNLPMLSDNSSFLKYGINSLSYFAGNLQTNNGLGFFETENHAKIMHNTDSKTTIDTVFGETFIENIELTALSTVSVLEAENFTPTNFASGQISSYLYSDWVLKGVCVILIGVGFGGYLVYYKVKNLPKTIIKKKK